MGPVLSESWELTFGIAYGIVIGVVLLAVSLIVVWLLGRNDRQE